MESPPPRPNYPSIRASCDRCRAKKLACVISTERTETGARQCVRCHRAKACCVFGPRAQNTRRKAAPKAPGEKKPRPLAKAAEPRPCEVLPLTPPPPPPLDGPWVEFPDGLSCVTPTSWFDGFIVGNAGECCGTGFDVHNFCHDEPLVLDHFLDPYPLLNFSDSSGMASWAPMDAWEYWGSLQHPLVPNQQPWADEGYSQYKLGAPGGGTNC